MPLFDRLGTAGTVALVGIGLVLRTILREVRLPTLVPFGTTDPTKLFRRAFCFSEFQTHLLLCVCFLQFLGDVGPLIIFGLAGIIFYMRSQTRAKQQALMVQAEALRGSQMNAMRVQNKRKGPSRGLGGSSGSNLFEQRRQSSRGNIGGNNSTFTGTATGMGQQSGMSYYRKKPQQSLKFRGGGGSNSREGRIANTENRINNDGGTVELNKKKPKARRVYTGRRKKNRKKTGAEGVTVAAAVPKED